MKEGRRQRTGWREKVQLWRKERERGGFLYRTALAFCWLNEKTEEKS